MRFLRSGSGVVYGAEAGPVRIDWLDLWTGRYCWPQFSWGKGRCRERR